MPTGYDDLAGVRLGNTLGDLLFGGARRDAMASQAYSDQLRRNYAAQRERALRDKAWEEARLARARAIAGADELGPAVLGVYGDTPQGRLNSALLRSMATPNVRNLGDFVTPDYLALRAEQRAALGSGDYRRMNAATAVLGDKQYEPLQLGAGGKAVFDPVLGDTTLTPLGEAAIDAENALTQQRVVSGEAATTRAAAAAEREQARADVYRRTDPNRPRGSGRASALAYRPLGEAQGDGFVSFDAIPPVAARQLKEGHKTTFGNGQTWTLVNGQPVRVK